MWELDGLDTLDDQQKSIIRRAGLFHPSEILLPSKQELLRKLDLVDSADVAAIVQAVSRGLTPRSLAVSDLVERDSRRWLQTGDAAIDMLLGGGVRRGTITEIAGESAAGKSHMALQLALTAQLSPFTSSPGSALLLTSERKVSFDRLAELAPHALAAARDAPMSSRATLPKTPQAMLDNVHTRDITEVDGLDHALTYIVPATIGRIAAQSASSSDVLPVRLLVIDSIGALFRATYSSNHSGLTQRSKMLCAITDKLKELAEVHDIAVVVVNQVTDVFTQDRSRRLVQAPDTPSSGSAGGVSVPVIEDDHGEPIMTYKNQSRSFSGQTQELSKEASLGLVWANGVNVRLMLSRTGRRRPLDHQDLRRRRHRATALEKEEADRSAEGQWQSTLIRRMHLVFSPFAPEARVDYIILDAGIRSVSDVQIHQPPDTMPSLADNGGIQSIPHDDDEFAGDLLDDLGELPAEFWTGEAFEEARVEAVERNALKQQEQGFTLRTDDVLAEDAASTPAPVATQAAEADGFAGTPDDVEP